MSDAGLLHGWREGLRDLVSSAAVREFKWGDWDCYVFASEACRIVSGRNLLMLYAGRYHDEESGNALVADEGGLRVGLGESLERLGWREIDPARARAGDLAIVMIGQTEACGVYYGAGVAVLGRRGVTMVRPRMAGAAWTYRADEG